MPQHVTRKWKEPNYKLGSVAILIDVELQS